MKRVLIFAIPERGHYNPFLRPAAALRNSGVEVVFAAPGDISDDLKDFRCLVPSHPQKAPQHRGQAFSELVDDPTRLKGWIRALLIDGQRALIPWCEELLLGEKPDAVAIDPMLYAAAIACGKQHVPWIGWSTSLNPLLNTDHTSELLRTIHSLSQCRDRLFEAHGIEPEFSGADVLSPHGTAVFATTSLGSSTRPNVKLVGPSCVPKPSTKKRLVYVSYGSQIWHQPKRYEQIIQALRETDFEVVFSMGELAASYDKKLPQNMRAHRYVDQLAVLAEASCFITHGGANSVMESISSKTPMLLDPVCNDQPHNAQFVQRAGLGFAVDVLSTSASQIRKAVLTLADSACIGSSIEAAAASYSKNDGAAGAAELVMKCL